MLSPHENQTRRRRPTAVEARFAGETPKQIAQHRRIERRYAWQAVEACERNSISPAQRITRFRLADLEHLFGDRYGSLLPDDDAGLDDLLIAFHHIAHLGGQIEAHMVAWARLWAPWMPEKRATGLAKAVANKPRRYTAATLGQHLRLTEEERTRLKITTFRAIDATEQPAERKRRLDRERKRRKQAEARAARPEAAIHAKPWEAEGISRRTWYRRRTTGTVAQNRSQAGTLLLATDFVPSTQVPPRREPSVQSVPRSRQHREGSAKVATDLPARAEPMACTDGAASAITKPLTPLPRTQEDVLVLEAATAVPIINTSRADRTFGLRAREEVIARAIEIDAEIGEHRKNLRLTAVRRLIEQRWPVHADWTDWGIQKLIEREIEARDQYRRRRAKHLDGIKQRKELSAQHDREMVAAWCRRDGIAWDADWEPDDVEIIAARSERRQEEKAEAWRIRQRDARPAGVTQCDMRRRRTALAWIVRSLPVEHPLRQSDDSDRDADAATLRNWINAVEAVREAIRWGPEPCQRRCAIVPS